MPLEAKSPYELRVGLGKDVPETTVREALRTGDMGFLHSFTTGSAVDGPGVRVVAWTTGCQFRCLYCHNPDTWTMPNGIPVAVTRAVEELRKYRHGLQVMSGGFTLSGGEPLMQDRFAVKLLAAAHGMGIHTALDTNGYLRRSPHRRRAPAHRPGAARPQGLGPRAPSPAHRHGQRPDARLCAPPGRAQAAHLGALRPGARRHRRSAGGREHRALRRGTRQRRARRRAARSIRWAASSGRGSG